MLEELSTELTIYLRTFRHFDSSPVDIFPPTGSFCLWTICHHAMDIAESTWKLTHHQVALKPLWLWACFQLL